MSNLGLYQVFTTVAKRVGGPGIALVLTMGSGVVVERASLALGKVIKKKVTNKAHIIKQAEDEAITYSVTAEGTSNEGLVLKVGDGFRVLETDGDVALIEVLGNDNNPYFVSTDFLRTISDYPRVSKEDKEDE